jgi:hypothetical protein
MAAKRPTCGEGKIMSALRRMSLGVNDGEEPNQYNCLLSKLGPFPTVSRVSQFLSEPVLKTWRRIELGEIERVNGTRVIRIKLASLIDLLNRKFDRQRATSRECFNRPKNQKSQLRASRGSGIWTPSRFCAMSGKGCQGTFLVMDLRGIGFPKFLGWLAQRKRKSKTS